MATRWIKTTISLFIISLSSSALGAVEPEINLRSFMKTPYPWLTGMFEGKIRGDARSDRFSSLKTGAYFRAHNRIKFGFFASREFGLIHNEDWVLHNGVPRFQDTKRRGETLFHLVAIYRLFHPWLGNNWVWEFKNRFVYNSFNDQWAFRFRHGITYLWKKQGEPFLNISGRHDMYIPLNWGRNFIYERWLYLDAMFIASPNWQLGGYGALRWTWWTESAQFNAQTGRAFEEKQLTLVIGLTAIYRFKI